MLAASKQEPFPQQRLNKHITEKSPKREIKETTSADNRIEMTKIIGEPSKIFNATMASAKTFEEQKGVSTASQKNDHTTLSKTPSINEM